MQRESTASELEVDELIESYANGIRSAIARGSQPFLVTWTFDPLLGSSEEIRTQMHERIRYTYEAFAVHAILPPLRDFREMPALVATAHCPAVSYPEAPLAPIGGPNLRRVEGLYARGILVVPWRNALCMPVVRHVAAVHQRDLYAAPETDISGMYVMPLVGKLDAAVAFVFDDVKKGRACAWEDVVSMPSGHYVQTLRRRPRSEWPVF